MEDPPNVEESISSGSNVSGKSTVSAQQANSAKREQVIQPITTEKISEASTSSQVAQKLQDEQKILYDTLRLIERIALEAEMYRQQIEDFSGTTTDDKDYVFLDEMLIRATVDLDAIDTRGNTTLRQERKRAVQYIQKLMRVLDSRLKENIRKIKYYKNTSDSDDTV